MNTLDIKQALNEFRHNQLAMGNPASPEDDKRYRHAAIAHCRMLIGNLEEMAKCMAGVGNYPVTELNALIQERKELLQIILNVEITANYGCEEDTLMAERAVTDYNEQTGLSSLTESSMRLVTVLSKDILDYWVVECPPFDEMAQLTWVNATVGRGHFSSLRFLIVKVAVDAHRAKEQPCHR